MARGFIEFARHTETVGHPFDAARRAQRGNPRIRGAVCAGGAGLPMDSRIDFPPPNTASSPPTQRSSVISMDRFVSASRIRSPVVGPNEESYS